MRNIFILLIFLFIYRNALTQKTDFKEIVFSNEITNVKDIHFFSADTVIVLGDLKNTFSSYYYSTNSGSNWKFLTRNNFKSQFSAYQSIKSWYGTLTGVNNFFYFSNDTGKTVQKITIEMEISGKIQVHDKVLFATLGHNSIGSFNLSLDYGKTWLIVQDSFVGNLVYTHDSILIVNGYYNNKKQNIYDYWLSNDLGKTLTGHGNKLNGKSLTYVSIDTAYYYDVNYTDNSFTINWSFDGGKNVYTKYTTNFGSPENGGHVKMATSMIGYRLGGSKLYKTYDGGQTWAYKYTFNCPVSTIEVIDKDNVYFHSIGGSAGVNKCIYITHNGAEPLVNTEKPVTKTNKFHLYPNPATQSITLQTPNDKTAELWIYNLMGQVQLYNTAQNPGSIDISRLSTGLYIFELRQGVQVFRQRVEIVR